MLEKCEMFDNEKEFHKRPLEKINETKTFINILSLDKLTFLLKCTTVT